MSTRNSYVFLGLPILLAITTTIHSGPNITITDAQIYLLKFGYLPAVGSGHNSDHAGLMDENAFTKAIEDFQKFSSLNVSGKLDEETKKVMSLPRCGVPDKVFRTGNRSKRYTLHGSRWRSKNITYKISSYPNNLNKTEVDAEIAKAFAVWSAYSNLRFTPKSTGNVIIEIKFVRRDHGDNDPFDGKGKVLAHGFFPKYGGQVHFDADEVWTINSPSGTNIRLVAAHEFGHSLGLRHTNITSAIMAPFYRGYNSTLKLHKDDILGIQKLYGKKTLQNTTSLSPSSTTPKALVTKLLYKKTLQNTTSLSPSSTTPKTVVTKLLYKKTLQNTTSLSPSSTTPKALVTKLLYKKTLQNTTSLSPSSTTPKALVTKLLYKKTLQNTTSLSPSSTTPKTVVTKLLYKKTLQNTTSLSPSSTTPKALVTKLLYKKTLQNTTSLSPSSTTPKALVTKLLYKKTLQNTTSLSPSSTTPKTVVKPKSVTTLKVPQRSKN